MFCLLYAYEASAQEEEYNPYKNVTVASPNAASLGKYGDIPVSYHTGIPNISVPIYSIQEGPLSMEIKMSYHASGLKVLETASWVGAGWSLHAGGVITRSIKSASDEKGASRTHQKSGYYTNYGFDNHLYDAASAPNSEVDTGEDWNSILVGALDAEPDLYFFDFNGYSGNFYFKPDHTVVVTPEQDLKIEVLPRTYNTKSLYSFDGWIVTTPDGVRYYFGQNNAVEVSRPKRPTRVTDGGVEMHAVSSWYLTKVESADRKFSINLSYDQEKYSYHTISTSSSSSIIEQLENPNLSCDGCHVLIKNVIDGVRLKEISFSNGLVEFVPDTALREDLSNYTDAYTVEDNPNTEARALKSIKIKAKQGQDQFCKEYEFKYDYFLSNGLYGGFDLIEELPDISSDRKRLKLNEIVEKSCSRSLAKPAYQFSYYEEDALPRRLSSAQDHWGYYNGANNNDGLIPSLSDNGEEFSRTEGAIRDAQWPAMRAGTLQKIIYPTGGVTEFTYGYHDAGINDNYWVDEKETYIASVSMYNDNQQGRTKTVTLQAGRYYTSVYASSQSTGATLYINDSNNLNIYTFSASSGETKENFFDLAAGTYTITISVHSPYEGGVSGELYTASTVYKSEPVMIGGLRIEQIRNHDGISSENDVVTSYEYTENGAPSGVLYSIPTYIGIIRNDIIKMAGRYAYNLDNNGYGCINIGSASSEKFKYYISAGSIYPMSTTQGSHIGYQQVTEKQAHGGYTVYQYYGSKNTLNTVSNRKIDCSICEYDTPNYPPAPLKMEYKRGKLKYEGSFTSGNAPIKEVFYDYHYSEEEAVGAPGIVVEAGSTGYRLATKYEQKSRRIVSEIREERTHSTSNPTAPPITIQKEIFYNSSRHSLPTSVSVKETVGNSEITRNINTTYVNDVLLPSLVYDNTLDSEYVQQINQRFDSYYTEIGTCNSSSTPEECKWLAYYKLQKDISSKRLNYIDSKKSFSTQLRTNLKNAYSQADIELKSILGLQFKNQMNTVLERTEFKDDQLIKAYYMEYKPFNSDTSQIYVSRVKVVNPSYDQVFTTFSNNDNTISIDAAYDDEASYIYDSNGNLIEVLGADGIYKTYVWGYNNLLPIAEITNAKHQEVTAAINSPTVISFVGPDNEPLSDELMRDQLSILRSRLPKALVTSYTYSPLNGITSKTDAAGQTFYYEYDGFGRLLKVSDEDKNLIQQYEYHYATE
jgi:YD repeat-containing protein